MQRERKLQAIQVTLGHEQLRKGAEAVFFCPRCKHRKPKLSVNLDTDRFHCWSCDWGGKTLIPLMSRDSKERNEYVAELEANKLKPATPEKKYDAPALPTEFRTLTKEWPGPYYKSAMRYLQDRGITIQDIRHWKLGYCEEGNYKHRIIVPSFDEYGVLNFVVGRSFYDNPQKYKHENLCKDVIFNEYMVDWNKPIVVTEGPFDAFKTGDNVTALQGSILREDSKLFSRLVFSGVEVYFAMDQDAFRKQLKILTNLVAYGVDCYYVPMGGKKDVGEMSKTEFREAKLQALPVGSSIDILRLRMKA